jgi:hypothetical protein
MESPPVKVQKARSRSILLPHGFPAIKAAVTARRRSPLANAIGSIVCKRPPKRRHDKRRDQGLPPKTIATVSGKSCIYYRPREAQRPAIASVRGPIPAIRRRFWFHRTGPKQKRRLATYVGAAPASQAHACPQQAATEARLVP